MNLREAYVKATQGKCRFCGCTHHDPCPEGCGWADKAHTLCTICAAMLEEIGNYLQSCRHVTRASMLRLFDAANQDFGNGGAA